MNIDKASAGLAASIMSVALASDDPLRQVQSSILIAIDKISSDDTMTFDSRAGALAATMQAAEACISALVGLFDAGDERVTENETVTRIIRLGKEACKDNDELAARNMMLMLPPVLAKTAFYKARAYRLPAVPPKETANIPAACYKMATTVVNAILWESKGEKPDDFLVEYMAKHYFTRLHGTPVDAVFPEDKAFAVTFDAEGCAFEEKVEMDKDALAKFEIAKRNEGAVAMLVVFPKSIDALASALQSTGEENVARVHLSALANFTTPVKRSHNRAIVGILADSEQCADSFTVALARAVDAGQVAELIAENPDVRVVHTGGGENKNVH